MARCPRCGRGPLFKGFLSLRESCPVCDLTYDFADSGDGPAVFISLIVGFIVLGGALVTEVMLRPSMWVHAVVWLPLGILLPLLILRPLKAMMIRQQYKTDAGAGNWLK